MPEVEHTLRNLTAKILSVESDRISREASFAEGLGIDSLDSVELQMAYEEAFEIEITDTDAGRLVTFGQAVDHVRSLLAAQGPSSPEGEERTAA
ncbi:acyl carrier protein [Cereibacter sphaeroides]|uniref:acyl carrier protein n=1 Tax=Cereibacter sphaeroides TaxID=1063 RepID=UPI001F1E4FC9|nr:acyl carrier protein [Cereibacter sphaeroides]MCE6960773.1 acyl carrier protein [Cereibacter sphaeroides]MCE6969961.1 acyl carrier protein [Cereibacter sphaeroides]MCE6974349.1 acyl carrier protein [Cereibacter sphaeroides]